MKKILIAGTMVLLATAAAFANDAAVPNSTNQHGRDRVDFYNAVPDLSSLPSASKETRPRTAKQAASTSHDRATQNR